MLKIAVLGAGGTGHALASDLTLAGFRVALYEEPELKDKLYDVLQNNYIELTGAIGESSAKIDSVTTDIKEALEDAEIILIAVGAIRHEKLAELCAPYLDNGQTLIVAPDNGGSLAISNIFRKMHINKDVNIAGVASNYYSCRLIGPGKVVIGLPRRTKRLAAFPASNTAKVLQKLSILNHVHDFTPGTNVLEIALSSSNIAIHLAGSLLNTGAIENSGGQYYLYQQGITPSVLKCVNAVAQERSELFKVMGYTINPSDILERVANKNQYPELELFRGLIGPTDMKHRYITEDASTGQSLMLSLAEMVGVPLPVTKSLLTLASVINQRDYAKEGRTMQRLGLYGMSINRLNQFLVEGS